MIISRYSNIITTMSFEQSLCSHLIEVTRYAFGTLLSIRFEIKILDKNTNTVDYCRELISAHS